MKTMILLILCMTLAAFGVRAQDMNVIHTDAQVTSLDLADIESVTFSQNALRGSGDILRVHAQSGLSQFAVNNIDSICFLAVTTMAIYQPVIGSTEFDLAYVDSLTFGASSESPITVTYSGTSATVVNPLEDLGVTVDVSGADVTVTAAAGLSGIEYLLSWHDIRRHVQDLLRRRLHAATERGSDHQPGRTGDQRPGG